MTTDFIIKDIMALRLAYILGSLTLGEASYHAIRRFSLKTYREAHTT